MIEALPPVRYIQKLEVDTVQLETSLIADYGPTKHFGSIAISEEDGRRFPAVGEVHRGGGRIMVPEPFQVPVVLHLDKSEGRGG